MLWIFIMAEETKASHCEFLYNFCKISVLLFMKYFSEDAWVLRNVKFHYGLVWHWFQK